MVALLVELKLRLLRNSLRRSGWRVVGLVVGSSLGLGLVAATMVGLVALRGTSTTVTAQVTVVAYAALALGWLLLSLIVFGVDETVEPARFALFPVRGRELAPGLLAAALVGVPGAATVLVALGLVVAWARTPVLVIAAVLAAVLGTSTCVLLSRTATSAFARFLSSRRFRDLAVVLLALLGIGLGSGVNLLLRHSAGLMSSAGGLAEALASTAAVASWSPFGWAWALPGDVAREDWTAAALHLLLAAALVAGLWEAWTHFLDRRLVEPLSGAGGASTVSGSEWVERLYPTGAAGAVSVRALRYWRREPRYLAALAGFLVTPLVLLVVLGVEPDGISWAAVFVPASLAMLVGFSTAMNLSYDGGAVWLHVSVGVRGVDDRWGRALAALTIFGPLVVIMHLVAAGATGGWSQLPAALAWSSALGLSGLGVGSWVGAWRQWPGASSDASPFAVDHLLSIMVSMLAVLIGEFVAGLPVLVLMLGGLLWRPWLGWLALPAGLFSGLAVLRLGVIQGGKLLDRRWSEVLWAVSERR